MDDERKERLIILISTLAGISCTVQNQFGGWEFWVPWVVLALLAALWYIHVTERFDGNVRVLLYFLYDEFLLFYHGVHDTSLFDLAVSAILFISTFAILDRALMLDVIMGEYAVVMAMQFWFLYKDKGTALSAFNVMRVIYHVGTVLVMYVFSRINIKTRLMEKEDLKRYEESVKKNDSDIEDFFSNVSHELRTPVNVISGMTSFLRRQGGDRELSAIREAGIRLSHQIEDIQDYTEIKRRELVLEEENYMCLSLMNDVVSHYNNTYKDRSLELILDMSPAIPSVLYGDVKKLNKLFRHIIDNAVKYTRRGGICIRFFAIPQEYGINLVIEVTDTGIGMTRADMARVSKGMYQANKKRNRSAGGIGIGLPIVYGFVHKMGGFVMIDSEKGSGTTVRISVPQKVVNSDPCLKLDGRERDGVIIYAELDRLKVPKVREFYRTMVSNLASDLKAEVYLAGEREELRSLFKERSISWLFIKREDYEADRVWIDGLTAGECNIGVITDTGYALSPGVRASLVKKPVYAASIVRLLNGEEDFSADVEDGEKKLDLDGVRALVVDDEPMNLIVASGIMKGYRMSVDTAESGPEAIKKYRSGSYDVIFMDHMMPQMDGVEAMKRLRDAAGEDGREPVVIALTANAVSGAKEMFIQEGFDGLVAKPIDLVQFERVMKRVIPGIKASRDKGENE